MFLSRQPKQPAQPTATSIDGAWVWSIFPILLELLIAECLCPRMSFILGAPRFRDDLFGPAAL